MKVQETLKVLGTSGCLCLCYAELAGIPLIDLINDFPRLVLNNIVTDEAYVRDADKLLAHFGINKKVEKIDVSKVPEHTPYIVPYENDGNTHFVIAKDGKVIYNTLEISYCVKYGKPSNIVRILV